MAKAYVRPENHGVSLPVVPSSPLPTTDSVSRKNLWGEFTCKLRTAFQSEVPTGYEDQEGFHYGAKQAGSGLNSATQS